MSQMWLLGTSDLRKTISLTRSLISAVILATLFTASGLEYSHADTLSGKQILDEVAPNQILLSNRTRGAFELKAGNLRSTTLAGGQDHSYVIRLSSGEFAILVVDPTDIELNVKVVGPAGNLIIDVPCPYGTAAAENIYVEGSITGLYRILIRPTRKFAKSGRYEIKFAVLRRTTLRDSMRAKAQRSLPVGYRVIDAQNDYRIPIRESLNALARLKESLRLSELSNDLHGQGGRGIELDGDYQQLFCDFLC